ncbi:MAG: SOS response-associated peptidase [Bacteroidales bacterium]|nr:SOS response-associated peptidase [Bacteroidales bacterium]MDD2570887.1 SOS response-associated peptidase [Bacteroidales bacterium]MDD2812943.1 SOS response-associated peptidase [Bacteroidales bacterium]MDD3385283.1 SOS response-associated peptidase [Bacteroidales bacterium]MDD3811052.1 SOS response-associated peptidase [Bacteroidales bacterium]
MCVFLSMRADQSHLQKRFGSVEIDLNFFKPAYLQSAFEFPRWPVITGEQPKRFSFLTWGLIPPWVRSAEEARKFRANTVNARAETLFDKPAFRSAAANRHCLVVVDGFFEFRELDGRKFPYFIRMREGQPFTMAGLHDTWVDPATGEVIPTFTIVTTRANGVMAKIHNRKKRMPVILPKEQEMEWLTAGSGGAELLAPCPDDWLQAWPVSGLITSRTAERNVPSVQEPYSYQELTNEKPLQGSLF